MAKINDEKPAFKETTGRKSVPRLSFLLTQDKKFVILVEAGKNLFGDFSKVFDLRGQTSCLRVLNPVKMCWLLVETLWTEVHSPKSEVFELPPAPFQELPVPLCGLKMGPCFEERSSGHGDLSRVLRRVSGTETLQRISPFHWDKEIWGLIMCFKSIAFSHAENFCSI